MHSYTINQNNPHRPIERSNRIELAGHFELIPQRSCTIITIHNARLSFFHSIYYRRELLEHMRSLMLDTFTQSKTTPTSCFFFRCDPSVSAPYAPKEYVCTAVCERVCGCGNGRVHQQHSNTQQANSSSSTSKSSKLKPNTV